MDSNVNDLRQYRKKRKRRKRFIKSLVALSVICLAFCLYFFRNTWYPKLQDVFYDIREYTQERNGSSDFPVDLGTSTSFSINKMDNKIAVLSDTYFTVFDTKGTEVFRSQHTMSNSVMKVAGSRAIVYDQGGFRFKVESRYKDLYEKKLESQIINATISSDGYVAVVTKSDKYASFMTVYDDNGEEIFYTSNSEKITSVAFTEGSNGCIISTMSIEKGQLVSRLWYYRFDTENEIWKSNTVPALIIDINICSDSNIIAVGDICSYCFSSDGILTDTFEYTGMMTNYCFYDTKLIVSQSNDNLREYQAVIYENGVADVVLDSDSKIRNVYISDTYAYMITDNNVLKWTLSGSLSETESVEYQYNDILTFSREAFLLGASFLDRIVI